MLLSGGCSAALCSCRCTDRPGRLAELFAQVLGAAGAHARGMNQPLAGERLCVDAARCAADHYLPQTRWAASLGASAPSRSPDHAEVHISLTSLLQVCRQAAWEAPPRAPALAVMVAHPAPAAWAAPPAAAAECRCAASLLPPAAQSQVHDFPQLLRWAAHPLRQCTPSTAEDLHPCDARHGQAADRRQFEEGQGAPHAPLL